LGFPLTGPELEFSHRFLAAYRLRSAHRAPGQMPFRRRRNSGIDQLKRADPPPGWHSIEYRLTSRCGGRAAVAWVPAGVEPRAAISKALGVAEDAITLKESPWQKHSEERSTPAPSAAPLNFAAMLQDEPADVGQLLIAPIFLGMPGAGAHSALN
jgi:hypothetical protein